MSLGTKCRQLRFRHNALRSPSPLVSYWLRLGMLPLPAHVILRFLKRFIDVQENHLQFRNGKLSLGMQREAGDIDARCRQMAQLVYELFLFPIYMHPFVRLQRDDVVVDIGANIGGFSIFANSFLNDSTQIYSIEPSSLAFADLERNVRHLNRLGCRLERIAISDSDGDAWITCRSNSLKNKLVDDPEQRAAEKVRRLTLDSFCDERSLVPSFVKIDVEGNEEKVILGMRRIIAVHRPRLSVASYHIMPSGETQHDGLKALLRSLDYTIVDFHNLHIYAY